MSDFVGYVNEITTRNGTSKQGKPYTAYNVRFTTKEGEQKTVGWGFNPPAFQEGVWVKTTVEQNGQYLNYKGAPVEAAPGPAPAAQSTTQDAPAGGGGKGGVVQQQIIYQNSRTAAIQFVLGMLDRDSLPVSGAKGKAGESKRYEQALDFVRKVTVEFYHDVDTLRLLESVADAGDVEVAARGELPEEVEPPSVPETEEDFDDDIPF